MNDVAKLLSKTKYFIGTGGLDCDNSFCNICNADAYELSRGKADVYGNRDYYWKVDHNPGCLLVILRRDLHIDPDDES